MKNEVVILKSQRYLYDRSIRAPGAKLVEVETAADVRAAIGKRTAMLFYLLNRPDDESATAAELISIAREHGVPCFEKNFSLTDVYGADEAFVTGIFAGVAPVGVIDGRTIGTGERGPMVDNLQQWYRELLERECASA